MSRTVRYTADAVDTLIMAIETFINTDPGDGEWSIRAEAMRYWAETAASHINELQEES